MAIEVGPVHTFSITGYVMPWSNTNNMPIILAMTDDHRDFLPVFSSVDKLNAILNALQIQFDKIKKIDDDGEFLSSIPRQITPGIDLLIIVDPYYTDRGTVRFKRILREWDIEDDDPRPLDS
jgi:hypothetical protein